jgi:hypothetical protein
MEKSNKKKKKKRKNEEKNTQNCNFFYHPYSKAPFLNPFLSLKNNPHQKIETKSAFFQPININYPSLFFFFCLLTLFFLLIFPEKRPSIPKNLKVKSLPRKKRK